MYLGTIDHNISFFWYGYVPYACLELSYLSFILEDTYRSYKTIRLQLRYQDLKYNQHRINKETI